MYTSLRASLLDYGSCLHVAPVVMLNLTPSFTTTSDTPTGPHWALPRGWAGRRSLEIRRGNVYQGGKGGRGLFAKGGVHSLAIKGGLFPLDSRPSAFVPADTPRRFSPLFITLLTVHHTAHFSSQHSLFSRCFPLPFSFSISP